MSVGVRSSSRKSSVDSENLRKAIAGIVGIIIISLSIYFGYHYYTRSFTVEERFSDEMWTIKLHRKSGWYSTGVKSKGAKTIFLIQEADGSPPANVLVRFCGDLNLTLQDFQEITKKEGVWGSCALELKMSESTHKDIASLRISTSKEEK